MPEPLLAPLLVLYAATLVALLAYAVNFLYLTWAAVRLPADPSTTAEPAVWPVVTVQLPIFNEVYVAERLVDAIARLDYPAGALEIQVLDDSTDDTSRIVAAAVERWRDAGVDVRHLRRERRAGFKAGALAAGLASARGSLIAIFDADFMPRPDFLRVAVPILAADPGLAFVQARWGHTNRDDSLLTSLQALSIDRHFSIEQRARSGLGYWFHFNGTAGIWRRAALVDAGGWLDDTLTEDLDLSYRAFLRGWRARYLDALEVPGEIPASINAYRRQQHRWARGRFECAIRHLPGVWRSAAPRAVKAEATLHLTGYAVHLLLLLLCGLFPLVLIGGGGRSVVVAGIGWIGIVSLLVPLPGILLTVGRRRVGQGWLRTLPRIALLSVLGAGLMVNTARAGWQAMRATPASFERTPKSGAGGGSSDWRRQRYQLALDRIVLVELGVVALNGVTAWAAVRQGSWAIALYAGLFAAGLLYVVALTIGQSVGAAALARGRPMDGMGEMGRALGPEAVGPATVGSSAGQRGA